MKPICSHHLNSIYSLFLNKGYERIRLLEKLTHYSPVNSLSLDDVRNEKDEYEILFSDECRSSVLYFYRDVLSRMGSLSYEESTSHLQVLIFLQQILATALWKFQVDIGDELSNFVREFDRLDVESERARLYAQAKGGFNWK